MSLLEIVARAGANLKGGSIRQIEITVGRLRAIETELLVSCFELLSESTDHAGAKLICREGPVTVICGDCGTHTELARMIASCPACASRAVSFVGGKELRVERILAG